MPIQLVSLLLMCFFSSIRTTAYRRIEAIQSTVQPGAGTKTPNVTNQCAHSKTELGRALPCRRLITGTISYSFTFPKDKDVDLRTLIGHRVTLRGQFSMRGKIGPFVVVSGQPVYLAPSGSFSWGKHYFRMEGKRVSVTGTLRFYKAPPPPEHSDSIAAALPDYFYFEAERAIVRLEKPRH